MPRLGFCPLSLALFLGTVVVGVSHVRSQTTSQKPKDDGGTSETTSPLQVVFVLGGPGSGKGTQCQLLTKRLPGPWVHLSAGDLLRAERKRADSSELGALIESKISSGQLVPSSVTCKLIQSAMEEYRKTQGISKFLVDGYPRGIENKTVWEAQVENATIEFVLFLDCPEEVLSGRLLDRGQTSGRSDDANMDVIRKRFHTYQQETAPIVKAYEEVGKVVRIQADRSIEEVYESIEASFADIK